MHYTLTLVAKNIFVPLRVMSFFLLEIVSACGPSFVFSDHGPYIYDDFLEAEADLIDSSEEAIIEVFLKLTGEIMTAYHDWSFFQRILAENGFSEVDYKNYVKSFLNTEAA